MRYKGLIASPSNTRFSPWSTLPPTRRCSTRCTCSLRYQYKILSVSIYHPRTESNPWGGNGKTSSCLPLSTSRPRRTFANSTVFNPPRFRTLLESSTALYMELKVGNQYRNIVSSAAFSTYLVKDSEVCIPLCAISWLTDDLTRLHRMHLADWHGAVFPESPSPQARPIPSHTRFSFALSFFLKKACDTLVLW